MESEGNRALRPTGFAEKRELLRAGTCATATAVLTLLAMAAAAQQQTYRLIDIGTLGGQYSAGRAINGTGQVTGGARATYYGDHAFLWDQHGIRDLGTLGSDYSWGVAINASGQVVGTSLRLPQLPGAGNPEHAFFWDGATMHDLGTLGGANSEATGINSAGQVIGNVFETTEYIHAFIWDEDGARYLGTLGGVNSHVTAINDSGQVIGSADTAEGGRHAYLWERGVMLDLGTFGGKSSYAQAVNAAGKVTGDAYFAGDEEAHAFVWDGAVKKDLGTLGGNYSGGRAINDLGQVVGFSQVARDSQTAHAFFWDGARMQDLGTLGGLNSWASDINRWGEVVGQSQIAGSDEYRAFLWDGTVLKDLNSLIDPSDPLKPYVTLRDAQKINDLGQILISSATDTRTGTYRAFLAVPAGSTDTTPPVIQANVIGTQGNLDWYVSDVTIQWFAADPESAVAQSAGCRTTGVYSDTSGVKFTCSSASIGGATAQSVTVKRDTVIPGIVVEQPMSGAIYTRGSTILANYRCDDSRSGVSACAGSVSFGEAIDTSTAGGKVFSVEAIDVAGNIAEQIVAYSVSASGPVPPVIPDQVAIEGVSFGFSVPRFSDPDGDELTYTFSGLPTWLKVSYPDQNPRYISGKPPFAESSAGQNKTYAITVVAMDPSGAMSMAEFKLTVLNGNEPPEPPTSIPEKLATEGVMFGYTVPAFTDPDGDALTYTFSGLPSWLKVAYPAQNPRYLEGQPPFTESTATTNKTYIITVRATDPSGAYATRPFTLTVLNVNSAPTPPAAIPNQLAYEAKSFGYAAPAFSDQDGNTLTYSFTGLPSWLKVSQPEVNPRYVSGRPPLTESSPEGNKTYTVTITATDPSGASASRSFNVVVADNRYPVPGAITNQTATENAAFSYNLLAFTDPDGDAISYTFYGLPSWLSVTSPSVNPRYLSGRPPYTESSLTQQRSYTITVNARDAVGQTTQRTFTLNVLNANRPPAPPTIANQTAYEGSAFSFNAPRFSDPDGDAMTYSFGGLPSWLRVTDSAVNDRYISGRPPYTEATPGNPAVYAITMTATDAAGATASRTFNLTVNDVLQ